MVVSFVQNELMLERSGFIRMPLLSVISPVFTSSRQMPISMMSLSMPSGGLPSQQVASTSTITILSNNFAVIPVPRISIKLNKK
jgi:hypothetical protein